MIDSKHNLSVRGPGLLKAFGEEEVCVFCHATHTNKPQTPMWNRSLSNLQYELYQSSTLSASPGQPTGSSKLCLSCHDGTIALGKVLSRPVKGLGLRARISGRANLETDLSDDHPISFRYDSELAATDPELVDPGMLKNGPVQLDGDDQMQCTSCHDSHSSDYPSLLVMDTAYSGLCVTCHDKAGWSGSAHEASPARWNGGGVDPWPDVPGDTVAENGCQSCHTAHSAGMHERLLVFETEEDNCLSCHNGNVARTNIAVELSKRSAHPVRSSLQDHDPAEDFTTMPRHVECQDCHNPHAVTDAEASAPFVNGALTLVGGVTAQGVHIEDARFEYEVCLRCHVNDPSTAIIRQVFQPDIRLQFDPSNASYHPVIASGRNPDVPSLLFSWTESSYVYCTDCHANDQGPGASGNGSRGPHGSMWPFLLEREYVTTDGATENSQSYALCYKCHSRSSILNDESFPTHRKHIVDARTSCATCHDPHGISADQGSATNHSHLINFNTEEVVANSQGQLFFEDLGTLSGSCSLSCHEFDHVDTLYQR